ncbi:PREDICTED: probable complex I intermediate-associated protein 30, mitochondrial [Papilio xuthus]|uniref:Probable complex I intermediate-associated protein 30, mitochondrial n=1 Tax=Papilio xuthus TaxID=66420 RepID=A0AAJ6ZEH7_PAPXU|nr:PREDICTED: probable complex I intermediate-associated protein 30, mitochondrial [Papilio xuthus]
MSIIFNKTLKTVIYFRHYSVLCKRLDNSPLLSCFAQSFIPVNRSLFWEKERKGGYRSQENVSYIEHMKNGYKELKVELKLFAKEMKEFLEADPLLIARPGETDLLWCFNEPTVLDNFVTTCDSDHNEGFSTCHFDMSPAGRANFHGYLDTRVPKDGRIKKAGYCAIRSKRVRKSFKRGSTYNWSLYNTLVLKVRGDGRSYLLNISCEGYYDITWNDIYHYVLYTRGGPYWQIAKIPFSKFVLGSKGRLQDRQSRMRFDKVTHFGVSCGDKINGPFNLEIEYVGLEFDPTHEEEFAYEMYKTDKYIVGV